MTLVHSDKSVRFTFDNKPQAIPAGVSDQPEDVWRFARGRGLASVRRATKAEAEPEPEPKPAPVEKKSKSAKPASEKPTDKEPGLASRVIDKGLGN